jgi:hypothetical protein
MQKLNPTIRMSTRDAETAFNNTRDSTEDLIVQSLVHGERLKGANGVYFNDLKLTPKGERAAIQERRKIPELEKALEDISKDDEKK